MPLKDGPRLLGSRAEGHHDHGVGLEALLAFAEAL
jgi:hypothetical protein